MIADTSLVAFSADRKTLASGGREEAVKLWDISEVMKDKS